MTPPTENKHLEKKDEIVWSYDEREYSLRKLIIERNVDVKVNIMSK